MVEKVAYNKDRKYKIMLIRNVWAPVEKPENSWDTRRVGGWGFQGEKHHVPEWEVPTINKYPFFSS